MGVGQNFIRLPKTQGVESFAKLCYLSFIGSGHLMKALSVSKPSSRLSNSSTGSYQYTWLTSPDWESPGRPQSVSAGCWLLPAKCHMQQISRRLKDQYYLCTSRLQRLISSYLIEIQTLTNFEMLLRKFHNEWKFLPAHCSIYVL